ncbi:MAG: hypothetical protein U5O69_03555 [Candidatus Competibacteraceae bacterium]|nr:hypothetical protein [Candidatus Competibacteraceae bacterium]
MNRNVQAFSWGTSIGTWADSLGLGGAEFRLPVLAGIFRFRLLDAIVINLLASLVTVIFSLVFQVGIGGLAPPPSSPRFARGSRFRPLP